MVSPADPAWPDLQYMLPLPKAQTIFGALQLHKCWKMEDQFNI